MLSSSWHGSIGLLVFVMILVHIVQHRAQERAHNDSFFQLHELGRPVSI